VNFIDVYHRTGLYPVGSGAPFVPGSEAAGVVEAVGEGVTMFAPGDRVAYGMALGAYAEARCVAADKLVPLPDDVDDVTAAAAMLKGMTARYLVRETFAVGRGHTVLVHAAAGGVGLLLCQWAAHLGAVVIGTVGSPEKAALARRHGCHHVVLYRTQDFAVAVREITGGAGCDVVYDGVGAATYPRSLDCLRPRGLFVSFGNASGPIRDFDLLGLSPRGSLYATRTSLATYIATRSALLANAAELFSVLRSGAVRVEIGSVRPLTEVRAAHEELEARRTTGATVLVPGAAR
jgi:NADPH2:quinone reductase